MDFVSLGILLAAVAAPAVDTPMPQFVGEIIIIGNTITRDRVIRSQVGFYPGQVLKTDELQATERRLASLGIFKIDPRRKLRPTVQVLPTPGPYKDILIRVEELETRSLHLAPGLNSQGHPIVRLILQDANYDAWRFPSSISDITEGRAFRGNGEKTRFEVVRLELFGPSIKFFADGGVWKGVLMALWRSYD